MNGTEAVIKVNEKRLVGNKYHESNGSYSSNSGGKEMLAEKLTAHSPAELGYTIRPATMNDLEMAVELFNVCSQQMIGKSEHTLPTVRTEWLLPEFDLQTATCMVFSPEGRLVGYIEVWDIDDPPVRNWVWGQVHPDYQGKELGTYLMDWAEQKLQRALSKTPGELRVTIEAGSYSNFIPARDLFEARDLREIRSFHTMVIELNELPPKPFWAKGIRVRTMKGLEEARDVIWTIEEAFRDHWGYVEQPFETEYQRWLHFIENDEQFDPALWFLAVENDEIVDVSSCRAKSNEDPDMAWVNTLGVRKPWRRRGVALALLHHTFREFYKRDKLSVGLGVDSASLTGATRLYEKAGMHTMRQFTVFEKELRSGRDIVRRSLD